MDDDRIPCVACARGIAADAPSYPDASGRLCAECAPTYADLIAPDAAFVDADGEPLTEIARWDLFNAHIAGGGKPGDTMARV